MNSRQLLLDAVNHKTTERIPIDFGGTAVTGIHVSCVAELREYYGFEKKPVKVIEPYQMLGEIDEELVEAMGIDTFSVVPEKNMFGFRNEDWKEWLTPFGLDVLVPENFKTVTDENNDLLIYPEGDLSAKPCAKMPSNGFFFDTIIRQPEFDQINPDPADNLEEFELLSNNDLDYFESECTKARQSDRAVVATIGGMAFGDIALVPAPFLKEPKGIRDIEEWYISTLTRQDFIHNIFEKQCEIAIKNLEQLAPRINDLVDIVFICGTDFGTQDSAFCSVDTFGSLYQPYYKRINDWIHQNTSWKTFKHSCGAVENFIPSFIDCGFDILNPVQCTAAGMEADKLKEKYGDKIVFWGGGADTQTTLSFGSAKEVYDITIKRCETFSKDGGFVFNTVHNIQAGTPIENIISMLKAYKDFNGIA